MKKELKEVMRRINAGAMEKRRAELLHTWLSYCSTIGVNRSDKYIGTGLITLAAPKKLDTVLELGDGYVAVHGDNYTLRVPTC